MDTVEGTSVRAATLRMGAAAALRKARALPVGGERNQYRQIASVLRAMLLSEETGLTAVGQNALQELNRIADAAKLKSVG